MDRSVANLNNEQLYRKRALDRANQRASRARKRTRVQELEEEVADLQRKLARSEVLVKRLQNNETCLREIIQSARVSLQMIDHHVIPPVHEEDQRPRAAVVATSSQTGAAQDAYQDRVSPNMNVETEQQPDTAAFIIPDAQEHNLVSSEALVAEPSDQPEGVMLKDVSTGLSLELPIAPDDAVFDISGGPSMYSST